MRQLKTKTYTRRSTIELKVILRVIAIIKNTKRRSTIELKVAM